MTFFWGQISIFAAKISDDLFFSRRPHFSDFPFLFPPFPYLCYVKCHIFNPFLTRKTHFYSVHTFTHIRQYYFSKYWGRPMHGPSPHLNFFFGGDRPPRLPPPRSPPLQVYMCLSSSPLC